MRKTYFYILLVLFLISIALNVFFVYGIFFYRVDNTFVTECGRYNKQEILINGKKIIMDVADDKCKIELGLSGTKEIKNSQGMLFVFDKIGNYGFWMKGMNYSIDVLWVDDDLSIIGIEKNLNPDTYPNIFGQKYLFKYVVELPSGFSDENNIVVGNKISVL